MASSDGLRSLTILFLTPLQARSFQLQEHRIWLVPETMVIARTTAVKAERRHLVSEAYNPKLKLVSNEVLKAHHPKRTQDESAAVKTRREKRRKLEEEKGIVISFVIGHSSTSDGILDKAIDAEARKHKDFLRLKHVEGYNELSAKTKIYFATAVALWDADFYLKIDDDVHVNIEDPRCKFIWEEMSYLERWWKDASETKKESFINLVKNAQLEIVGGGWVMNDEMEELMKNQMFATHAVAAAGSVTLGTALTYPLDTIKVLIQVGSVSNKQLTTAQVLDRVKTLSGHAGLYSGFGWLMLGRILGAGARFGTYEILTAFYKGFCVLGLWEYYYVWRDYFLVPGDSSSSVLFEIPTNKVTLFAIIVFAIIPTSLFNVYNVCKVVQARKGSMLLALAM
ncbi:unnamed protein product [Camellia sinensis]